MQYIEDTQRLGKANKWLLPTRPTTGHAKAETRDSAAPRHWSRGGDFARSARGNEGLLVLKSAELMNRGSVSTTVSPPMNVLASSREPSAESSMRASVGIRSRHDTISET